MIVWMCVLIVWAVGDQFGVEFEQSFDEQDPQQQYFEEGKYSTDFPLATYTTLMHLYFIHMHVSKLLNPKDDPSTFTRIPCYPGFMHFGRILLALQSPFAKC